MSKQLWLQLAKMQPNFVKNEPNLAKMLAKYAKDCKLVENFA